MCMPIGSCLEKNLRAKVSLIITGTGATVAADDFAWDGAGWVSEPADALVAVSSAAFTAASVSSVDEKSAESKARPARIGIRIAEKKPGPTVRTSVLTFVLAGAPSRCTSSAE